MIVRYRSQPLDLRYAGVDQRLTPVTRSARVIDEIIA
jgi:hypothetical protein